MIRTLNSVPSFLFLKSNLARPTIPHYFIRSGPVRKPEGYQAMLNSKPKVELDMRLRPQSFRRPHPEVQIKQNRYTQVPLPLKYKLQELPENYDPLIPLGISQELPFYIERTKSGNLPIYRDYRLNRQQKLTIVRKISGDVEELMTELKKICSNS